MKHRLCTVSRQSPGRCLSVWPPPSGCAPAGRRSWSRSSPLPLAELQAAKTLSREELVDSLPRLLDELARALENGAIEANAEEIGRIGLEHGRVRVDQCVYSLRDLLTEYRILRRVVLTALRDGGELDGAARGSRQRLARPGDGSLRGRAGEAPFRRRAGPSGAGRGTASARHDFKASPAAMALWRGPEMVFEMVNPAYQAIFPGRELLGRPFLEALPEFKGQPFFDVFSRVLETGEPFVGREVLARHRSTRDGPIEDHYYDFTYVRIEDLDGGPYGVYDHAIDVTERVLARRAAEESRQKLQESVSDLERVQELRERFVATISHDLRTPLSAARISAQLVARRAEDPDAVRKSVGRIADNLERADRMIRDLLDVSRLNARETLPLEPRAMRPGTDCRRYPRGAEHGSRGPLRPSSRRAAGGSLERQRAAENPREPVRQRHQVRRAGSAHPRLGPAVRAAREASRSQRRSTHTSSGARAPLRSIPEKRLGAAGRADGMGARAHAREGAHGGTRWPGGRREQRRSWNDVRGHAPSGRARRQTHARLSTGPVSWRSLPRVSHTIGGGTGG